MNIKKKNRFKHKVTEKRLMRRKPLVPYVDTRDYCHGPLNVWNRNKGYKPSSRHGTRVGKCRECKGILKWDSKHGERVCRKCGLVID